MSWATSANALVTFGNQAPITNTNASVINDNNNDPSTGQLSPQRKAVGFTTDSRNWTLNGVTLGLLSYDSADNAIIEIRSDSGGSPGTTLLTLNRPAIIPGGGGRRYFTFTPSGSNVLAANTTYWLYVSGSSYSWFENGPVDPITGEAQEDASGNALPGPLPTAQNGSGWQFVDYKFTGNGSLNWGPGNGVRNAFSIDASEITPVPFAFSPIPGLIVSGIIGGVKRARSKSHQAKSTAEA
ncbi:choice-of-anchor R domain-containing protein [Leptolyngbya sp. AS-A5]